MGKLTIICLCVAWIICPLDGDWLPVFGWLDDVLAGYIALQVAKSN